MHQRPTDIDLLCPYTGLRSFTEEESIYFKGRDGQIDLVAKQLSERKFLMLTGASGDGKSSLIYAGLVPQAKSGFFKAKYSNWSIVDFRPERTPLRNLLNAVSRTFQLDVLSVETELNRGFSSLVDIYLNSNLYADTHEIVSANSDAERRQLKYKASNLLIIVDQFEEFFTNPENFSGEAPGHDAQLVVNLMLETARIALERELPIYVVFTMRSDYIGQCNTFRGLPEFIGYSQFFVPRLNRSELRQVIEEPAALNGNSISRRLAERLIYDLNEGIDQLPILQHALRQIWVQAAETGEEMDLIHYAMVGGLPFEELPGNDKERFNTWIQQQPPSQRELYQNARLGSVIEIHARKLYNNAIERYASQAIVALHAREIKRCIAITFACLTKIDNGRAVRHRMSVREIAAIINVPSVTHEVLADILQIFRLPDNSFIRPFTFEVQGKLASDAVLDITHESLIRNWSMLLRWANQEYNFYTTFEDVSKHLKRWKDSGMNSGYLIPIGPLTFFEKWYSECKPNSAWIKRYLDKTENTTADQLHAESVLTDLQRYLKQSARKVAVSRLLVKHGAGKIIGWFSVVLLVLVGGFFLYNLYRRQPAVVIKQVISEGRTLFRSPNVPMDSKANYFFTEEYHSPGAGFELLKTVPSLEDRMIVLWEAYTYGYPSPSFHGSNIRTKIIAELQSLMQSPDFKALKPGTQFRIKAAITQLYATESYYDGDKISESTLHQNAGELFESIESFFKNGLPADKSVLFDQTTTLNEGVQLWLAFGNATHDQILHLISLISPRHPGNRFDEIYKAGAREVSGYRYLSYGGGYHMLASLYASVGDIDNVLWCFEKQLGSTEYFEDRLYSTRSNVIGFLYQYGHRNLVGKTVSWLVEHFPQLSALQIYDDLVCRSAYLSEFDRLKFGLQSNGSEGGTYPLNLCRGSREQYQSIVEDYERTVGQLSDPVEREFRLAMHYKRLGLFSERYHNDRGIENNDDLKSYYQKAFTHFSNLSETGEAVVLTFPYYYVFEIRTQSMSRRQMFLYPDVLGNWQLSQRHGDSFFEYMINKGTLESTYASLTDLRLIPVWANTMGNRWRTIRGHNEVLARAIKLVDSHPQGSQVDINNLKIMLSRQYFVDGDTAKGMAVVRQIDIPLLEASKQRYSVVEKTTFLNELMALSGFVAAAGHPELSSTLNRTFSPTPARIIAYLYGVEISIFKNQPEVARILMDSATHMAEPIKLNVIPSWLNFAQHYNYNAFALGNREQIALAEELYRNSPTIYRVAILGRRSRGLIQRGQLYEARQFIPRTFTEGQDILSHARLVENYTHGTENADPEIRQIYRELFYVRYWFTSFYGGGAG
ncbi:hypothetical protein WBG78_10635 [Chryseolinea sp. T2]|uniref:nSTAND1 domain-containing NTPase n=1 Tax=Chryseolinea sp. T2 TaxID=3129255 RepID=UPI003077E682